MDKAHEEVLEEITRLQQRLAEAQMPELLRDRTEGMVKRLVRMATTGFYSQEFEQVTHYVDWVVSLPWYKRSEDVLDLEFAQRTLDETHFGLQTIKDRILEYIAVMELKQRQLKEDTDKSDEEVVAELMRAPIMLFVGLVGTGKTTISKSIAESMGREFVRIPFGGLGSALTLRGESRARPDAEVGAVMKAMRRIQVKNPVILLDEIDRVSEHARADIMGVLVELLDPGQNYAFIDHFIDFPFDLSQCMFIATSNNTNNIATAVLDRMEVIRMPSYTDEEKIHIARDYVLPKVRREAGLRENQLTISDDAWPLVVRPLGFDSGIRTLERTINGIARKVARQILEGQTEGLHIDTDNIKPYLPTW